MNCAPKSHRQHLNLRCTRGFVAGQAVAPYSLYAAVATVVNAIAATGAGPQRDGSSDAPLAVAISRLKRADMLTAFANAPIGSALSGARDASRSPVDQHAGHRQALRAAQMLPLWLPAPLD